MGCGVGSVHLGASVENRFAGGENAGGGGGSVLDVLDAAIDSFGKGDVHADDNLGDGVLGVDLAGGLDVDVHGGVVVPEEGLDGVAADDAVLGEDDGDVVHGLEELHALGGEITEGGESLDGRGSDRVHVGVDEFAGLGMGLFGRLVGADHKTEHDGHEDEGTDDGSNSNFLHPGCMRLGVDLRARDLLEIGVVEHSGSGLVP